MNERGTLDKPARSEPSASPSLDLEVAADQAIAACGGDGREAVKELLAAVDFLEAQVDDLPAAVSTGYARRRYDMQRDRRSDCDGCHLLRRPALRRRRRG